MGKHHPKHLRRHPLSQQPHRGWSLPTLFFCSDSNPAVLRFWPVIDDHFRKVAYEKRIRLRLLVGCWGHSKPNMFPFLRSLAALQDNRTHYSLEVVRGPDGVLPFPK